MDLDPDSWGGLKLGLKIGHVKTSSRDHHFSMTAMATGCFLMFRMALITNMTSKHQFSKISRAHPRFENFRYPPKFNIS